jgi:GAF domain-containing protein
LQQTAWLIIPLLTVGLGLMQVARSMAGPPWIWETVHYLLDRFQEHVFEKQVGTPLHYHRVTLFRHIRLRRSLCRWPWSGWLVPVERSGHTTRKSRAAFLAPDDADRAEGIAGQTWAQKRVVIVEDLPDISGTPSLGLLEDYARKTWVSVEWLQNRSQHARSFCGIPVEVKGRLWGVIVLDSRSPDAIDQDAVKVHSLIGRYLGKLLERA